jgi:hypothetical protein
VLFRTAPAIHGISERRTYRGWRSKSTPTGLSGEVLGRALPEIKLNVSACTALA